MENLPPEIIAEILRHALDSPDSTDDLTAALDENVCSADFIAPRYPHILLTCSHWYELGIPFLLNTVVLMTQLDSSLSSLMYLQTLLHRRPDLVIHVRRLIINIRSFDELAMLKDVLTLCGSHIREFGWFIPVVDASADVDLLDRCLRCVQPIFAAVYSHFPYNGLIATSLITFWVQARLQKMYVIMQEAVDHDSKFWVAQLQVQEVHVPNAIVADWPLLLLASKNPGVRVIYISPMRNQRARICRLLEGSSEEVKAVIRIVDNSRLG